ncbi:DUF1549 and DUF1553 domain-containing protein [Armatimonas rosea]|uniref:DUF1553 domain-containing protein n=1 Tax=Armatimonas rosea TaxID=685828 RepID=A0A7W9W8D3_ARMRO|nr:DUF1549 and DUF1553 domain-containing protein [Armatimonas rosea]MBB6052653.1 hypothetical protein [Armatimonas rosea]
MRLAPLLLLTLLSLIPRSTGAQERVGPAWSDRRNPIVEIFGGKRLDLWSLRPLKKAPQGSTIDSLLGTTRAPLADKRTLARRLRFDLTGLPPTAGEVATFTTAETFASGLLEQHSYGEHQARLWLDVVRYSDSNGFDWDEFRPLAWRYRDYVVRSFNADKPYDRFLTEQLAGDELVAGRPKTAAEQDALLATSYLRLGPWDNSAGLFGEANRVRNALMNDLVETTGTAFLGLTLACARCHNHKTEPLAQTDFYRFRAFFEGVTFRDDLSLALAPDQEPLKALLATDGERAPAATHVLVGGDLNQPKEEVSYGFPSVLDPNPVSLVRPARPKSTGRRLTLARWIASRNNPLTARVLVNRVWKQLFGEGLVATPGDFGYAGARPANQAVLDFLASYFIESGWSVKKLQRLIVASRAYKSVHAPRRLSAEQLRDAVLATSGQLTERFGGPPIWPPLPDEVLKANPAFLDDNKEKTKGWYPSPTERQGVRSLYLVQKRTVAVPLLATFDLPDNALSCSRRTTSTVAPQALTLLNNPFLTEAALAFARRVEKHPEPDKVQVAFRLALQRSPHADERRLCEELLKKHGLSALCRALLNLNEFVYLD